MVLIKKSNTIVENKHSFDLYFKIDMLKFKLASISRNQNLAAVSFSLDLGPDIFHQSIFYDSQQITAVLIYTLKLVNT